MQVRRSLSPGKVFFEENGVVSKMTVERLGGKLRKPAANTGWRITGNILIQWGVTGGGLPFEQIEFPRAFGGTPTVQANIQGARIGISDITPVGFSVVCSADNIPWMAIGPG